MTTTKKSVSRKSGRIALSCALLALMFLSGCGNEASYKKSAASIVQDADTDGDGIPDVSDPDSLGLTSPSASGAKK